MLISISACETYEAYSLGDVLNSWKGSDIDSFIRKNGYPTSSVELPNGNRVYKFTSYSGDRQWWCTKELEVSGTLIVSWAWEGNNCE